MDRSIFAALADFYAEHPPHGDDFSRTLAHLAHIVTTMTFAVEQRGETSRPYHLSKLGSTSEGAL